jgi:hypothetical protein
MQYVILSPFLRQTSSYIQGTSHMLAVLYIFRDGAVTEIETAVLIGNICPSGDSKYSASLETEDRVLDSFVNCVLSLLLWHYPLGSNGFQHTSCMELLGLSRLETEWTKRIRLPAGGNNFSLEERCDETYRTEALVGRFQACVLFWVWVMLPGCLWNEIE